MAPSGTTSFNANRDQLITQALRLVNAVPAGETPTDILIQDTAFMMNAMTKHWQATGIHLWTVKEATLFPQINQRAYSIGPGSTDHIAETYLTNELTATVGAGAVSLPVASTAGIAAGYQVGVFLDDGTIFWTTVNGTPTPLAIPLAAGLPDSASLLSDIFSYQANIVRPLRIPFARRNNLISNIDTPLTPISRKDFHDLPNKDQPGGSINRWWYDPQRDVGVLNIWQMPQTLTDLVRFTWYKPIDDFDASSDTPDLPQEWILTLIFNLAVVIAPGHDVPEKKFQQLVAQSGVYLDQVSGWDREPESVEFGIDWEGRR